MRRKKIDLDERFTDLADTISTAVGRYPASILALVALVIWLGLGPVFHFSDTWQLIANTPTTWVELFLGFFACAATNRAERNLHKVLAQLQRMEGEHGTLLRELHAHISCQGHTHVGATPQAAGRHAVRGADGRYVKRSEAEG